INFSNLSNASAAKAHFADAKWALAADALERLEKLMGEFASSDLIAKHRWLFDDQFPETGFLERDYEGRRNELESRRREAVKEILEAQGWEGVHRLIQTVRYSYIIGPVTAELAESNAALLNAMNSW